MDGLHSSCFLSFDDEAVALACTDLALKLHGAQVPLDSHSKKSWRKAICSNTDWSLIKAQVDSGFILDLLKYDFVQ